MDKEKIWYFDSKDNHLYTRCDYCGKLHNELDLKEVKNAHDLICKKCERINNDI